MILRLEESDQYGPRRLFCDEIVQVTWRRMEELYAVEITLY